MDIIHYITTNYGVTFEFKLTSEDYDLISVSSIFPDLIDVIMDRLNGVNDEYEGVKDDN